MIWQILFNKFPDVKHACTCAGATGKLQNICLGVNILCRVAMPEGPLFPFVDFNGNVQLLKALRINSRSS